jgi:hypothetical protein
MEKGLPAMGARGKEEAKHLPPHRPALNSQRIKEEKENIQNINNKKYEIFLKKSCLS